LDASSGSNLRHQICDVKYMTSNLRHQRNIKFETDPHNLHE